MADQGPSLLPKNVRKAVTRVTEKLFIDNHAQANYHRTRDVRRGEHGLITSIREFMLALLFMHRTFH